MKKKLMQLVVLLTVGSGMLVSVKAETIATNVEPSRLAGISAEINEILNENEVSQRDLIVKLNKLNKNENDGIISIERNEVVVVKSSLDDLTDTEVKTKEYNEDKKEKTLPEVSTKVIDTSKTVYAKNKVNVRVLPTEESDVITKIEKGKEIKVTGEVGKWYRVQYKDGDAFVSKELCVDNKEIEEQTEVHKEQTYNTEWNGKKLTKQAGTIMGPSGKETYYNLNMSGIVKRLKRLGYEGDYWVREDGVKMYGDYVLVAASFDIRPIGTILPTSLGMGLVADTGGFAKNNKYQLDIATAW